MSGIEIKSISDLLDYMSKHNTISGDTSLPPWYKPNPLLWYRGQSKSEYSLLPGAMRELFVKRAMETDPLSPDGCPELSLEISIINQFLSRGASLIPADYNSVDTYFFLQHHKIPTRLLDWSLSPLVALFFAVNSNTDNDGALYVLKSRYNFSSFEHIDVLQQSDEKISTVVERLFNKDIDFLESQPKLPFRIIPSATKGRIKNQQSCFTLHLPASLDIERKFPEAIDKIIVKYNSKKPIMRDLNLLGINWFNLFASADDLSHELKVGAGLSLKSNKTN